MQFLMESWGKFARLQQIRERQISWVLPDASGIVGGAPTKSSLNQLMPVLPVLASLKRPASQPRSTTIAQGWKRCKRPPSPRSRLRARARRRADRGGRHLRNELQAYARTGMGVRIFHELMLIACSGLYWRLRRADGRERQARPRTSSEPPL